MKKTAIIYLITFISSLVQGQNVELLIDKVIVSAYSNEFEGNIVVVNEYDEYGPSFKILGRIVNSSKEKIKGKDIEIEIVNNKSVIHSSEIYSSHENGKTLFSLKCLPPSDTLNIEFESYLYYDYSKGECVVLPDNFRRTTYNLKKKILKTISNVYFQTKNSEIKVNISETICFFE